MKTYIGLRVYIPGTVPGILKIGSLNFIKTLGRGNFYTRKIKCACLRITMTNFKLLKRKVYPGVESIKVQY